MKQLTEELKSFGGYLENLNMKYYFICYEVPYRSVGSDGVLHIFKKYNKVINIEPLEWLKIQPERFRGRVVLVFCQEISKEGYENYYGLFDDE